MRKNILKEAYIRILESDKIYYIILYYCAYKKVDIYNKAFIGNYSYIFINATIVAKTREPKDEQLCKAVNNNNTYTHV